MLLARFDQWQRRRTRPAFVVGVFKKFSEDRAGQLAALIAYYSFFSLFPLLLVLTTSLGYVLNGNSELQQRIAGSALSHIPVVGESLQTGALLGGAIVTERVFSIAGIGTMLIDGIFNRDFPVIQGAMLFIIVCVAAVNLIVDILYSAIDPRIRY